MYGLTNISIISKFKIKINSGLYFPGVTFAQFLFTGCNKAVFYLLIVDFAHFGVAKATQNVLMGLEFSVLRQKSRA